MLTVSSGCFLINDFVCAIISSKRNKQDFILNINYVGIGRFVLALKADGKYVNEDIRKAYDEFMRKHDEKYSEDEFIWEGLKALIMSKRQALILLSLKYHMVIYDIENTKNMKHKKLKQQWLNDWKEVMESNPQPDYGSLFIEDENNLYVNIQLEASINKDNNWFKLIIIELMLFKPYHFLDYNRDKDYKNLKYKNDFLLDHLGESQNLVSKKDIKQIMKS